MRFLPGGVLGNKVLTCVFILLAFSFNGCSVGDFIGAYFNTYYNARKAFIEAETEVLTQQDPKQAGKVFLGPFIVPSSAKTKFASVIEKCSKLLQYHPESSLVDDALMMVGKSFYYQNEHEKAERKFRELLDGYPGSNLVLEARLLLVNTLYRMNNKEDARTLALELVELALAENESSIAANATMVLGTIEADNGNHAAARDHYLRSAEHARSSEDRFAAWMRVAEMEQELEGFTAAAKAYDEAESHSSTYLSDYQARIGLARMSSKLELHEESLDILEGLLMNTNNRDFFGEINLAIADVYKASGDIQSAVAQYTYVDTTYPRTEVAARSYYTLGLLYEKELFNYDSARIAYNKGKGESPQASVTPLLVERSEFLNRYFTLHADIAKNDSLRLAILNPPVPEIPDTAMVPEGEDIELVPDEPSQDEGGEPLQEMDTLSIEIAEGLVPPPDPDTPPKDSAQVTSPPVPQAPQVPIDTVESRLANAKTELASLFYTGLQVPDSAEYWFKRLLKDHPTSRMVPRALYTLAQVYASTPTVPRESIDSLHQRITSEFPHSEFADASRRILGLPPISQQQDEAENVYVEAEGLMLSGEHKAAIPLFSSVVRDHPESPWSPRALYAIGWIYENRTIQADSAILRYEELVDRYPESDFAIKVKPKLAQVEAHRLSLQQPPEAPDSTQKGDGDPEIKKEGDVKEAPPQLDVQDSVRIGKPIQTPDLPDRPKP